MDDQNEVQLFKIKLKMGRVQPIESFFPEGFSPEFIDSFCRLNGRKNKENFLNSRRDEFIYNLISTNKGKNLSEIFIVRIKKTRIFQDALKMIKGKIVTPEIKLSETFILSKREKLKKIYFKEQKRGGEDLPFLEKESEKFISIKWKFKGFSEEFLLIKQTN